MTIMEALDAKLENDTPSMTIMEALGGQGGMTIAEAVAQAEIAPSNEEPTEPSNEDPTEP